jgi:RND family efflux transporter MFP subunit
MRLGKPLSAVALISMGLTACREAPRQAEASVHPQAVDVPVIQVASVDLPSFYEAVGTVRARTSAVIASQIMGSVRDVKVRTGDSVAAGQLLVTIDSRDLDVAVRERHAAREEALSARGEVDHAVTAAQANLDLAKVTFRRMQELYDKKSISDQEHDEATARLKAAQAAYDMAVAKRAQVGAKIQQASEAVSSAEVMRGYAEIHAPFAGIVTEKPVEPGAMAIPGTPLLTVEQTGALRLEAPVEESFLPSIRIGLPVTVTLDSVDHTYEARVSEIGPLVDPASRAFLVKIDLPNVPRLRSGMFGRAKFSRGSRQALVVPMAAVSEQGQLQSVIVVEDGSAHTRLVTLGQKQGDMVEILSGLNAGERVVSPRSMTLADGARVEAKP